MVLEGAGLEITLPAGWHGRFVRRSPHLIALQAASFPLAEDDDELGSRSVAGMAAGDVLMALVEYEPGSGVEPGKVPFHQAGLELPLDPTRFSTGVMTQSFTQRGRPFYLQIVLAGSRLDRRRQLPLLDRILGSLQVAEREPGRESDVGRR